MAAVSWTTDLLRVWMQAVVRVKSATVQCSNKDDNNDHMFIDWGVVGALFIGSAAIVYVGAANDRLLEGLHRTSPRRKEAMILARGWATRGGGEPWERGQRTTGGNIISSGRVTAPFLVGVEAGIR